mgnify:CR=1 FL=1
MCTKLGQELSLQELLGKIECEIERLGENIVDYVNSEKGSLYSDVFTCDGWKSVSGFDAWKDSIEEGSGLYVFRFCSDIVVDKEKFNKVKYACPKMKRNDNSLVIKARKGGVLYLGKSEGKIKDRINQHIIWKEERKKTSSLRLAHRNRAKNKLHLEVAVFYLNPSYKMYEKILLTGVESCLHEKLNPECGSSKNS